jgi:hypothetical protein
MQYVLYWLFYWLFTHIVIFRDKEGMMNALCTVLVILLAVYPYSHSSFLSLAGSKAVCI